MGTISFIKMRWYYLALLCIFLLFPLIVTNRYLVLVAIMSTISAVAAASMNLILGYTGQFSLAQAGFFGIGAYGVAILTTHGVSFWLALPVSVLVAAAVGLLIGLVTLRMRGAYFAIATMCFGVIVVIVAGAWINLTGGYTGINLIPKPNPIPLPFMGQINFSSQIAQYYLVLACLLLTLFVMYRLVFSLKGLSLMAVRDNELLAEAVGVNTFAAKLLSFVVATVFTALVGGVYASLMGTLTPDAASLNLTFDWIIYVFLGGVASLAGPVIGTYAITFLMEYLQALADYRLIVFGVILILVITYLPRGMVGVWDDLVRKVRVFRASPPSGTVAAPADRDPEGGRI